MKSTSSKISAIALACVDILVVAIAIALFFMDKISDTTFWTVIIIACLAASPLFYLAAHGITSGIKSPQEQAAADADDIVLDDLELPRTLESTIFEAIAVIVLIAVTYVGFTTHFQNISGRNLAGVSIITSGLLVSAYTPRPSFLWGEMHNLWQVRCSARLHRILALMFAIYMLMRLCEGFYSPMVGNVYGVIIILTYIVGRIVQIRGRNRS